MLASEELDSKKPCEEGDFGPAWVFEAALPAT